MERRSATISAAFAHSAKKQRTVQVQVQARPLPEYAMISCFDEPDRLVEVSTRLLSESNCRLYGVIKHTAPGVQTMTRIPFWRSSMTRAMLLTFVRSLQHGELSLGKGVSVAEALTTFEFENVAIGVPAEKAGEAKLLRMPPLGVVFQKQHQPVGEVILRTCEQIATAVAKWPRLESCLNSALCGTTSTNTCTATRVWIRFCRKPTLRYEKAESMVLVARKWPHWAMSMATTFGVIHARLVRDGVIQEKARDAAAFETLQSAIYAEPLGYFFPTIYDASRSSMDTHARREWTKADKFANDVRVAVLEASSFPNDVSAEASVYGRSVLSLADTLIHDAPAPNLVFGGNCCDENGKSPERLQLSKSLSNRGIKIARWCNGEERAPSKPLVFPSHWSEGPAGLNYCAVLLDFTAVRS